MNKRTKRFLSFTFAGLSFAMPALAQSTLENITVRKYQRNSQECKNPSDFNINVFPYTTLSKIIDDVDKNTVLEIGDGAHNSAAIRSLFINIARELAAKAKIRYYLEFVAEKPGLTALTRDIPLNFES